MGDRMGTMMLLDQLRQWQNEDSGGPAQWQPAWERALELLSPVWPNEEMWWGTALADGGGALATALYIVAREQNIAPAGVHRAQVSELIDHHSENESEILLSWECPRTAGRPGERSFQVLVGGQLISLSGRTFRSSVGSG
ncbi:hypothetical protein ACIA74_40855 [Streptomyces sp. NPDC051658]|uniref:hypothetical protein n=1 Tax=Streptomyces sp. NPDC051658 TaxID=3365667 RepID=UPI0037ABD56B